MSTFTYLAEMLPDGPVPYVLLGISVLTFVAGLIFVPWLIVRVPADYFLREGRGTWGWAGQHPVLRAVLRIVKNVLGMVLLVSGVVMLAVPGPGLVAILAAISLLDLPGKLWLERKIISHPAVLNTINKLRAKHGQPPLLVPRGSLT